MVREVDDDRLKAIHDPGQALVVDAVGRVADVEFLCADEAL